MIKTLGWESLEDRRKKLRDQMLYKIINNIVILPSTPLSRMESSCYDLRDFNNQRINPHFAELTHINIHSILKQSNYGTTYPCNLSVDSPSFISFQNLLHKYIV